MTKKAVKTGKELERRVAQAYRQMGAYPEHDKDLAGNQIDVYVEWVIPDRSPHRIAVEAKNWTSRVGKPIVNDFAQIVNLLRSERLIEVGIIVSSVGFTRPARTAAEKYGIGLLELADLEKIAARVQAGVLPQSVPRVSLAPSLDPETLCDHFGIARYTFEVYRTLSWENEQSEWGKKVAGIRDLLASHGLDCGSVVPDDPCFKRVAKMCGFPRWWNIPVITKLMKLATTDLADLNDADEENKANCLYRWLSRTPFANKYRDEDEYIDWGFPLYRPGVRYGLQNHTLQRNSPVWKRQHEELAVFWGGFAVQLEKDAQSDRDAMEIWECRLNILYHDLCRAGNLSPVLIEACERLLEVDANPERCRYCLKRLSEIIDDAQSFHRPFAQSGVMERWTKDIRDIACVLKACPRDEDENILVDHLALLEEFWEPLVQEDIFNGFSDPQLRRRIWVHIGGLRLERGDDLNELLGTYHRAGDDFAPGHVGQGKAYLEWGRYQEAIQCFGRVIEMEGPSFDKVLALRGRAHRLCGQWQDSLKDLEDALSRQPDAGWVWLELAQVRQHLEDYEESQRGFQKAVELGLAASDEFAAHFGLADVSEKLEDYETAIEASSFLIEQTQPEDDEMLIKLYSRRAHLYSRKGAVSKSTEDYQTAIDTLSYLVEQTSPEDNEILIELYNRRADLFSQAGNEDMAALDREQAQELRSQQSDEGR